MQSTKAFLRLGVLLCLVLLEGCYYLQAAGGHFGVMSRREPIARLVDAADTPPELRRRLSLVLEARAFSISDLGLPDNDSYLSYADLDRRYVVWNVFATPEFSLEPYTWCYPLIGCMAYRGYFREDKARSVAARMHGRGYDTAVGGVAAYSTLGRFDDPVLNTMMRWDDVRLVGTLFHELAHQVVYISDDTAFNESFATAVEELGLERWLAARGEGAALASYHRRRAMHRDILRLVAEARAELGEIFRIEDEKRRRAAKRERLDALSASVRARLAREQLPTGHWLAGEISNAHLVPMALYDRYVPAFRRLFETCDEDFACFYDKVKRLGREAAEARRSKLDDLLPSGPAASVCGHRGVPAGTGSGCSPQSRSGRRASRHGAG